jgi:hypothetical protein
MKDAIQKAIEAARHAMFEGHAWPSLAQGYLETLVNAAKELQALQTSRPDVDRLEALEVFTSLFTPDECECDGDGWVKAKTYDQRRPFPAKEYDLIRAALKSGDTAFLPTTDYYDPEKLTAEQRAQYERLIGSALLHAKTWAPTDKEYMAAKTGAHRAVIGLIKHGLLPPTSEGV